MKDSFKMTKCMEKGNQFKKILFMKEFYYNFQEILKMIIIMEQALFNMMIMEKKLFIMDNLKIIFQMDKELLLIIKLNMKGYLNKI